MTHYPITACKNEPSGTQECNDNRPAEHVLGWSALRFKLQFVRLLTADKHISWHKIRQKTINNGRKGGSIQKKTIIIFASFSLTCGRHWKPLAWMPSLSRAITAIPWTLRRLIATTIPIWKPGNRSFAASIWNNTVGRRKHVACYGKRVTFNQETTDAKLRKDAMECFDSRDKNFASGKRKKVSSGEFVTGLWHSGCYNMAELWNRST